MLTGAIYMPLYGLTAGSFADPGREGATKNPSMCIDGSLLLGQTCKQPVRKEDLELLLQAGTLPTAGAQEIKATAADLAVAFDNNFVDAGAAGQESTFHTDTVGRDAADGKRGVCSVVVSEENDPFEFLDTFAIPFLDLYMHGDVIAGQQIRDVRVNRSFNAS